MPAYLAHTQRLGTFQVPPDALPPIDVTLPRRRPGPRTGYAGFVHSFESCQSTMSGVACIHLRSK